MKEGFNAFTEDCNKYLTGYYKVSEYNIGTYLWDSGYIETNKRVPFDVEDTPERCFVVFRVPGATRGAIEIDGNTMIITDIIFYEETCFDYSKGTGCFSKDVLKLREKYIGTIYSN